MELEQKIMKGLKRHHGSIKALQERHGCSDEWVRRVLLGKQKDEQLLLTAAKLIRELDQAKMAQRKQAIQVMEEIEEYALASF